MANDKPEPIPRKTPKKRTGPSMREQIAARRRASEAGLDAEPASQPAKRSAPKAPAKAAAKPAPKASVKAVPAKRAARPAAATSDDSARPASRTSARRAGGGTGRSRRGGDDDEELDAPRGRRGRPPEKKKSAMPLIAAGVLVIGGGAGVYFSGMLNGKDTEASETDTESGAAEAGTNADGTKPVTIEGEEGTTPEGEGTPAANGDGAAVADGEGAEAGAPKEAAPKGPTPKGAKLTAYSTEELTAMVAALEPFERPEEVAEERWTELNADAELVFTPFGGRKSNAAKGRLAEDGNLYAWPVLINKMMKIDYSDPEQVMHGMAASAAMTGARGSTNSMGLGWETPAQTGTDELLEKSHRKDLMLTITSHRSWSKVLEDRDHWKNKLYRGDSYKEAKELAKKSAEKELKEGEIDLDDLDIDLGDGE